MRPRFATYMLALLLGWSVQVSGASAHGHTLLESVALSNGAKLRLLPIAHSQLALGTASLAEAQSADYRAARRRLLFGRIFASVGVGLASSGVLMAAEGGRRRYCHDVDRFTRLESSVYVGRSVAAVGVGAVVAGVILLATSSRAARRTRPILSWRLPVAAAGSLGAFVLASVLQFAVTAPEWVPCVSS